MKIERLWALYPTGPGWRGEPALYRSAVSAEQARNKCVAPACCVEEVLAAVTEDDRAIILGKVEDAIEVER